MLKERVTIEELKSIVRIQPVVAYMTLPKCLEKILPGGFFIPEKTCPCTEDPNQYMTIVGFGIPKKEEKEAYLKCSGYFIVRPVLVPIIKGDGHIRVCILKDNLNN